MFPPDVQTQELEEAILCDPGCAEGAGTVVDAAPAERTR